MNYSDWYTRTEELVWLTLLISAKSLVGISLDQTVLEITLIACVWPDGTKTIPCFCEK